MKFSQFTGALALCSSLILSACGGSGGGGDDGGGGTPAPVKEATTVTITSPSTGSTVTGEFKITADIAGDDAATITSVVFKSGPITSTDTSAPFEATFDSSNWSNNNWVFVAEAMNGATLVDSDSVVITSDNPPPSNDTISVSFDLPANNASFTIGTPVNISASATATQAVSKVEISVDGTLVNTDMSPPYTHLWDTTGAAAGTHTILAKAFDVNGLTDTTSISVTLQPVVVPGDPTVTLTAPTNGASYDIGDIVTLAATATADGAATVSKVEFIVNNVVMNVDTQAPYSFDWNTAGLQAGNYNIMAKVTDSGTKTATSLTASVNVKQPQQAGDPTVSLQEPANNATYTIGDVVSMTANASADTGATVSKVEFIVNGTTVSTDMTSPYSFNWNTTGLAAGNYQVTAKVTDSNDKTATSNAATVALAEAQQQDTTAPVINSFTTTPNSPVDAGAVVTINANVTDNVGVAAVTVWANGALKGVMSGTGPAYTYAWNTTGLSGVIALQIKAVDAANNEKISSTINFTVNEDNFQSPPKVDMQKITSFGDNPGDLKMFLYVPEGLNRNAPVVVGLHGCNQNGKALLGNAGEMANATGHADAYSKDSGWNVLADKYKFIVIYPEQTVRVTNVNDANKVNNDYACFNWAGFFGENFGRDKGETKSVKSMIDKVKADYSVANDRVFVTGLSAGAGLTNTLLAHYPEVFAGGAPMSGIAYDCATYDGGTGTTIKSRAFSCMGVDSKFKMMPGGMPDNLKRTPQQWGDLVRADGPANYTGPYPRVLVWQGSADDYVDYDQLTEIMEQWTNVNGVDQTADNAEKRIKAADANHVFQEYHDASGKAVVGTVTINGMIHGISTDPGTEEDQGGRAGASASGVQPFAAWAHDKNVFSSYYTAKWWGLLDAGEPEPGAPTVSISSPTNGSKVSGNVSINVAASDDVGIASVTIEINNAAVATLNAAPYTYSWNTDLEQDGSYTIKATATNLLGKTSNATVTVTKGFVATCTDFNGTMYAHRTATPARATLLAGTTYTYQLVGSNEEVTLSALDAVTKAYDVRETADGYFEFGNCAEIGL